MSASSFACLLLPLHVPDGVPELSLSLARSYLALTRHDAPKPNRTGASACTICLHIPGKEPDISQKEKMHTTKGEDHRGLTCQKTPSRARQNLWAPHDH